MALEIEKVYRLNMHYTFGVINHLPQFKKLQFNKDDDAD